ncbi:hypothetical protein SCHPADRAFT_920879 [Schizopora paradoxa]|uniref:Glutamine amidotransferase type-2 domain-containing protein n=1 Tax=Schizopora paradoxa TaxID=27342 RepID=A0A0H2RX43_9AGAM|nr:hypothetical protein SCHPADRAFT_920879 [Schizopora paradoxa]
MCGILVSAQHNSTPHDVLDEVWEELTVRNAQRGPDGNSCVTRSTENGCDIQLFASELQLRGEENVLQPHISPITGDVLCWNGEIFEGMDITGLSRENDGVKLMDRIQESEDPLASLPALFASLEGPYAFAYFENRTKTLYFGRDVLGRRSLLVHAPSQNEPFLILASVSCGLKKSMEFEELSTEGIFRIRFDAWTERESPPKIETIHFFDRSSLSINKSLPECPPILDEDSLPNEISEGVDAFIDCLHKSVDLRVSSIPSPRAQGARLAVLFSGGVDSSILALMADRFVPTGESIDLLNVAFENPRKIFLESSPQAERTAKRKDRTPNLNDPHSNTSSYDVPDRLTGREELEELRRLRPKRRWKFVEINVPYKESSSARPVIESLMYPQKTVMDMSLGLALYFASRGVGEVEDEGGTRRSYTSVARVLLSGLGADELGGGYTRHRTAFDSGGWVALRDELQLELNRISDRNLGRDDRIVSSHGKELRVPFLSLSVVKYCASLPVHFKVDPRLPHGVGDKLLIRETARRLGMTLASRRRKRAMQFGTRSAKMELDDPNERHGDLLVHRESS